MAKVKDFLLKHTQTDRQTGTQTDRKTLDALKRSVMITQEICPIRAEISTHKHLGKCIYLLFV